MSKDRLQGVWFDTYEEARDYALNTLKESMILSDRQRIRSIERLESDGIKYDQLLTETEYVESN